MKQLFSSICRTMKTVKIIFHNFYGALLITIVGEGETRNIKLSAHSHYDWSQLKLVGAASMMMMELR